MPFDGAGEAMLSKSPKIQHIVFSVSAAASLREALSSAGRDDRVLAFPDCLACGPIDPPSPTRRLRWLVSELGYSREDWNWLPKSVYTFWGRVCEPASRRIVWTSSRTANEHAAFLAWIERMAEQEFDVIDMAEMPVTFKADDGRLWRDKAISLGMMGPGSIAEEVLWERATPLRNADKETHLATWLRLKEENAPFRVIGPEGLTSQPISYFDNALLAQASHQWQRAIRLVGGVMAEGSGSYHQVGDHPLASRLLLLVASGDLEFRPPSGADPNYAYEFGHGRLAFHAEVRLPQ